MFLSRANENVSLDIESSRNPPFRLSYLPSHSGEEAFTLHHLQGSGVIRKNLKAGMIKFSFLQLHGDAAQCSLAEYP